MKWKISKDEFEKLPEEMKKEYSLSGESATLKVEGEGAPTTEAVERAENKLRIEKDHRKNAETARDAAEAASEKLKADLGKASGKDEIARINAEHQAELEKIRADREAEQKATKDAQANVLKTDTAKTFAEKHFTIPGIMVDQFAKRLSVEEVDGTPVVRVLDAEGKASALSLDELKKEFLDNKEFSPIIKSDVGNGGGAAPGGGGGGASQKKLSEMSATEEAQFEKADPEGYSAALAEEVG